MLIQLNEILYCSFQVFREAKRTSPSIIYVPHIEQWWEVTGDSLKATFLQLLKDVEPTAPILLLATCDIHPGNLPGEVSITVPIELSSTI